MFHPLPWDRFTWLWSAGVMLVLLASLLGSIRWHRHALASGGQAAASAGAVYLCLALIAALPLTAPLGVRLREGSLQVVRLWGGGGVDLNRVEAVEVIDHGEAFGPGCWRVFGVGGPFGMYGRFHSRSLGWFRAAVTWRGELVLVRLRGASPLVLSPGEPGRLAEALRAAAAARQSGGPP
jgi:hypothetical protein